MVPHARVTATQRTALLVGSALSLTLLIVYTLLLIRRDRTDVLRSLVYNGPIAFVLLVLVSDLVVDARHGTPSAVVRSQCCHTDRVVDSGYSAGASTWSSRIEISGHMTWAPLLAADAWIREFPAWFVTVAMLGAVAAAYLKLGGFGGPSGWLGLVAGAVLVGVLVCCSTVERSGRDAG